MRHLDFLPKCDAKASAAKNGVAFCKYLLTNIGMTHDPFGAIGDPTRRFLLEQLRDAPKTVNELAHGLPMSRPAVSQHLKVLLDAKLVTAEARGTSRVYHLQDLGFLRLNVWIDQFWSEDD